MTTTRPSTTRKVTRKTEEKRTSDLDRGIRMTVAGEVYEVRLGDVTSLLARELRAKTGVGWQGLQSQLAADPDVDLIATFVWFARRVRGEFVQLDSVEVTYADLLADGFDIELAEDAEVVDPGPEAPGGNS